jgi:hypothetical protein
MEFGGEASLSDALPHMRRSLPTIAAFAALICIAAFLWRRQAAITATLTNLQLQAAELRSQLEARDQTITDLRSSIERLQQSTLGTMPAKRIQQPDSAASTEIEFARRLAEMTVLQSNTLALVEKLMGQVTNLQPTESPQQKQAGLVVLEQSVTEFQQKVDAARQRTADLLVTLNMPAEVSTMDPSKALATASLKPYWPFFESLREREHLTFLLEKLQARLLQDQLDARAAAEKARAQ